MVAVVKNIYQAKRIPNLVNQSLCSFFFRIRFFGYALFIDIHNSLLNGSCLCNFHCSSVFHGETQKKDGTDEKRAASMKFSMNSAYRLYFLSFPASFVFYFYFLCIRVQKTSLFPIQLFSKTRKSI